MQSQLEREAAELSTEEKNAPVTVGYNKGE